MNLFLINILFFFVGYVVHPVHVSMCNLEFNGKESIIAVKLFADDFTTVLQNKYMQNIDLTGADEEPCKKYITDYIRSNLKITVNRNKSLTLLYNHSEINDLSIWLYFKTDVISPSEPLKISDTLMLDLYEDQNNLLIINQHGKEKGFQFTNRLREMDIELK